MSDIIFRANDCPTSRCCAWRKVSLTNLSFFRTDSNRDDKEAQPERTSKVQHSGVSRKRAGEGIVLDPLIFLCEFLSHTVAAVRSILDNAGLLWCKESWLPAQLPGPSQPDERKRLDRQGVQSLEYGGMYVLSRVCASQSMGIVGAGFKNMKAVRHGVLLDRQFPASACPAVDPPEGLLWKQCPTVPPGLHHPPDNYLRPFPCHVVLLL
jgi:hypothetical protein